MATHHPGPWKYPDSALPDNCQNGLVMINKAFEDLQKTYLNPMSVHIMDKSKEGKDSATYHRPLAQSEIHAMGQRVPLIMMAIAQLADAFRPGPHHVPTPSQGGGTHPAPTPPTNPTQPTNPIQPAKPTQPVNPAPPTNPVTPGQSGTTNNPASGTSTSLGALAWSYPPAARPDKPNSTPTTMIDVAFDDLQVYIVSLLRAAVIKAKEAKGTSTNKQATEIEIEALVSKMGRVKYALDDLQTVFIKQPDANPARPPK